MAAMLGGAGLDLLTVGAAQAHDDLDRGDHHALGRLGQPGDLNRRARDVDDRLVILVVEMVMLGDIGVEEGLLALETETWRSSPASENWRSVL